jgi:hypothetical protein
LTHFKFFFESFSFYWICETNWNCQLTQT